MCRMKWGTSRLCSISTCIFGFHPFVSDRRYCLGKIPISPLSRRTTLTRQSDGQSAECMTRVNVDFQTRDAEALLHPLTILVTQNNGELVGTGSWKGLEHKQKMQKPIERKQAFLFRSSAMLETQFFGPGCFVQVEQLGTFWLMLAAFCCLLGSSQNKRNEFLHSVARKLQLWCFIVRITNFIFRRNVFTAIYHFDGKCRATPENSVPYCWGLTQSQLATLHAMCETFPNTWTQNNTFVSKRQYCGCHCWHHAKSKALVNLNARQRPCNDASYTTVK